MLTFDPVSLPHMSCCSVDSQACLVIGPCCHQTVCCTFLIAYLQVHIASVWLIAKLTSRMLPATSCFHFRSACASAATVDLAPYCQVQVNHIAKTRPRLDSNYALQGHIGRYDPRLESCGQPFQGTGASEGRLEVKGLASSPMKLGTLSATCHSPWQTMHVKHTETSKMLAWVSSRGT